MEQINEDSNKDKTESTGATTGDTSATEAVQAAKISFWNYVAFSAIGFIALGPLSYILADRNQWYVLFPAALFVGAWSYRSMWGSVVTGLLWAGLAFLLLSGQFGAPYHFVKQDIRQLTDPAYLAQIAENHPKKLVRREAVRNESLKDENLFSQIINTDPDWEVRLAALERITDQKVLIEVSCNNTPTLRKAAVKKLADAKVLKDISENDDVWYVRKEAKSRLEELTK